MSSVGFLGVAGRRLEGDRRLALLERQTQGLGQLHRVAVALDVHVHGRRLRPQQVVVQGGDLDAALGQAAHDRVDLGLGEDEVAHDHGLVAGFLEGEPGAERQGRLDRDPVERDLEVRARQAEPMHAARLRRRRPAEDLLDLRPVGRGLRRCRERDDEDTDAERRRSPEHH